MNIKEVKDLIQEILQSDISEFELQHTGTKIRLRRGYGPDSALPSPAHARTVSLSYAPVHPATSEPGSPQTDTAGDPEEASLHIVTSPIVGTVYRAPNPESEPYVKPGDKVHAGSILCLVEAMKLMNEIPSDIDGEIARIYIENAHPVEFGQKLFGIRPEKQGG
ncbi:MAG: acetyl-CoA carboxylase biotin carboxyl carrier protein [Acidobacteria bacterium]|nr:acetyl-CoA carboxylase biotin carboxyl carrier protein [Acidobacteriota bacterium]